MRTNSFATGRSVSGLTAPVQKQAPQTVLGQSIVSGVKGGIHRKYGIVRKKVALFKERERKLRMLEKKAREEAKREGAPAGGRDEAARRLRE